MVHATIAQPSARDRGINHLQEAELGADARERLERPFEVLPLVRRGHLHADAGRSFRHDGETEAGHEHAAVEELRRQLDRAGRLADDDRDDRRLAVEGR